MDNFNFQMTAEGSLKDAIQLVFKYGNVRSCYGYAIRGAEPKGEYQKAKPLRLVFFQYPNKNKYIKDMVDFPFEMDADGVADFSQRWLNGSADYGREPDHDGDNNKGWTVYNEAWGHVDGQYQAFIAVTPTWAMYGK